MQIDYKQQVIKELIEELLKEGLRVFIDHSATYGFFSNTDGSRVISFSVRFSSVVFSGNYITDSPKQTGTGWLIDEETPYTFCEMLNMPAPRWALGTAKLIRYTSVEDKLRMYGKSSKYHEVTEEDGYAS